MSNNRPGLDIAAGEPADARLLAKPLSRRLLLRGGAAVAPVVMAATPRSVMAGSCTMASAFTSVMSVAASHQASMYTCAGHGPTYWRDCVVKDAWPMSCRSTTTACGTMYFKDVCGGGYSDTTTMMNVLKIAVPTVKDQLAQHIVAAFLNARKSLVPTNVVSEATLKSMWKSAGVFSGYYEPTAGVKWYANHSKPKGAGGGCIAWLKSTMS
jgi:hypothetical protein